MRSLFNSSFRADLWEKIKAYFVMVFKIVYAILGLYTVHLVMLIMISKYRRISPDYVRTTVETTGIIRNSFVVAIIAAGAILFIRFLYNRIQKDR